MFAPLYLSLPQLYMNTILDKYCSPLLLSALFFLFTTTHTEQHFDTNTHTTQPNFPTTTTMDVIIEPRCDVCGVKAITLVTCPGCRLHRVCQEHNTEAMRQAHQPLCEAVVDAWNDVLDTDFRARQATCQEHP